ncbi:uncharacterized protein [Triticum aestivum]|uniref:uncharacterized protein n=1 Tax=Triticum aestivum TaxID=4565 RepID=UPI001D00F38B|nr:uncharacterized protein LOC123114052 [Triticum aestivum]
MNAMPDNAAANVAPVIQPPVAVAPSSLRFGSFQVEVGDAGSSTASASLPIRLNPSSHKPHLICPEAALDLNSPPPDLSAPVDGLADRLQLHLIKAIHDLDEVAAATARRLNLSPPRSTQASHRAPHPPPVPSAYRNRGPPTFAPIPTPPRQPFIVVPSQLVQDDIARYAFVHFCTPVHNPFPEIRRVLRERGGTPVFRAAASFCGAGLVSFPSAAARHGVITRGPMHVDGNTISFEPAENHGRSTALFKDDLTELEAIGFPLELWHPSGVHFVLNFLGEIFSIDQYCLLSDERTSIRAHVALFKGTTLPDALTVQLPNLDILVVQLHEHGKVTRISLSDPSPFSSDGDSDSASDSASDSDSPTPNPSIGLQCAAAAMAAFGPFTVSPEFPQGPPPSPSRNASLAADTFVELAISSSDDDVPLARIGLAPPVLLDSILSDIPADPSCPISSPDLCMPDPAPAPAASDGPATLTTAPRAASPVVYSRRRRATVAPALPSLPALDLEAEPVVHEAVAKKGRACRRRASSVLHIRRSARLAELEPYKKETMQDKASKAKAKRLELGNFARDFDDVVRSARLYPDDV